MSYKLTYFPFGGRGEQIRLFLHAFGQSFEDVHVNRAAFVEMKGQGPGVLPFGSLPVLQDGELVLAQGPVILSYLARKHGAMPADAGEAARADSICWAAEDLRVKYYGQAGSSATDEQRTGFVQDVWIGRWRPNLEALLALNGGNGFFVGESLTHADIGIWDVVDNLSRKVEGVNFDDAPLLQAFYEGVKATPAIGEYLGKRTTG